MCVCVRVHACGVCVCGCAVAQLVREFLWSLYIRDLAALQIQVSDGEL